MHPLNLDQGDVTDALAAAFDFFDEACGDEAAPPTDDANGTDDSDDALVTAALQLIDEVYDSGHNRDLLKRRRFSRQQEETLRLRRQVDDLQQCRAALRCRDPQTRQRTRLWFQVASRQRTERDQALEYNVLLRDAASQQRELAEQTLHVLNYAHEMLSAVRSSQASPEPVFRSLITNALVPPVLAQRLDAMRAYARSPCKDLTVTNAFQKERSVQWSDAHDAVQFEFRITALYPFKLSAIAQALWKLMSEYSIDASSAPNQFVHHDKVSCRFAFHVDKPFGSMAIKGLSAMQRTYPSDGSVLLASTSVSTGSPNTANLMAGLEMHEGVRMRIARRDDANPRSPVAVEIVSHVHIKASDTHLLEKKKDNDSENVAVRLRRLEQFAMLCSEEDGGRTQQDLENRFIGCSFRSL